MKNVKDIFMYSLGALIAIGFFVTLIYLITNGNFKQEVGIVLGALVASFSMVVSYFYGSSKGSADKTDILKNDK